MGKNQGSEQVGAQTKNQRKSLKFPLLEGLSQYLEEVGRDAFTRYKDCLS